MTYRCVHCVYSEIINRDTCDMNCLKQDKTVKCMDNHCDSLILEPLLFISHICYNENHRISYNKMFNWKDSDRMAAGILMKHGFAGMTVPEKFKENNKEE